MPDQMPRSSPIVRANALYFPLLHTVLAKVPHARLEGFLDGDGRMGLRDADESDVFGAPPNAICSGRDSFLYPKKIFFNGRLRHGSRSEEHTSELQSLAYLVCRLLLEKKKPGSIAVRRCKGSR